jgi:ParB family transcriptional regulator, chromosome partitioning protein
MKHAFETREIALKLLTLHPDNVRAGSGAGYGEDQIAPLAANIAECGLLQPLLVAPVKTDGGPDVWGVLAGGRRLAALNMLAADKSVKGYTGSMMVPCRIVPETQAAQVTLSYSENALQLPMDALDRYEAFAAMRAKDGADVATIARRFAITERAVKEALRLGNIHPDLRQAHRNGGLSLEALKAFDAHPDPVVQMEAYEALSEHGVSRVQDWSVRNYFSGRYVRVGDALGKVVLDGYKAAGGEIIADLIEEDSVLSDRALVDKVLADCLSDAADARREALGLAWSDYLLKPDWELTHRYGRVYPEPVELEGDAKAQADKITDRILEIEDLYDQHDDDDDAQQALHDEHVALSDQLNEMTTGYSVINAVLGGVLAVWTGREIKFYDGMVRPEDMPDRSPAQGASDTGADGAQQAEDTAVQDKWSEKLKADMAHIRTRSIGLALAQTPQLARDYADYALIRSILKPYSSYDIGTTLRGEAGSSRMAEAEGCLKAIEDTYLALSEQLALGWLDLSGADGFAAFRALSEQERAALFAYAVAQTLKPTLSRKAPDAVRGIVEAEALPNIRDVWTPDEGYFGRLTKPALLSILKTDIGMVAQAETYEKSKKSEIVDYMHALFAAPFATLSAEQRTRVDTWAPKAMQTAIAAGDAHATVQTEEAEACGDEPVSGTPAEPSEADMASLGCPA